MSCSFVCFDCSPPIPHWSNRSDVVERRGCADAGLTTSASPRLEGDTPRHVKAAEAAGSGYVHGPKLKEHTDEVRSAQVKNLGGVMLWDGTMAMENLDSRGLGYLHYAKAAMG
ncbi:hypothetical protein LTR75_003209 [Friedmanniomyces endolithicus]|nr:hypothetical protein LTR75_003209 [Friedmanniomyces endolithicus]